ncbi:MAG: hypothetical protein AAB400_03670 [Patescibacteria group bacterium]
MVVFLSDILCDIKDFAYSCVKPVKDVWHDSRDALSEYSKKRLYKKIHQSILRSHSKSPSLFTLTRRGIHWLTYHVARFEALHQTPHVSRELILKELLPKATGGAPFLASLPAITSNPIAIGATAIGATVGMFAVCKTCRVKTCGFCEKLFHLTRGIGAQTRQDIALIGSFFARIIRVANSFHIPIPHITVPQLALPTITLPKISLPGIRLPRIRIPVFAKNYIPFEETASSVLAILVKLSRICIRLGALKLPRFALPSFHLPHIRLSLHIPQFKPPHIRLPRFATKFRTPTLTLPHFSLQHWLFQLKNWYSNFLLKKFDSASLPPIQHHTNGPKKMSFFRKYYVTEVIVLAIIFGTVGIFMSIYADTASNRANMPIIYQGRLMDASYVPVSDNNTYYFRFKITTASDGTGCVWATGSCGTPASITAAVSRGLFTVVLGTGTGNNSSLSGINFDTNTHYLEATVCGTTDSGCQTLTPRKQIGGVTYSYNSDLLDGLNYDDFLLRSPTTNAQTLTFTGTTTDALTVNATSLTSGTVLMLTGPSSGTVGVTDAILKITSDVGNIGTTNGLISSTATIDSTAASASAVNLYLSTINSNATEANSVYGIYATSTDAVALGNTNYGIYNTVGNTGALTSGTKTLYGNYTSVSGTLAGSGGSTNVYGNYITTTATHPNDAGTVNNYGLYIANGTSSTNGSSTKYGLYIAEPTGADTNYGAIVAGGNVGIGTTAPSTSLYILSPNTVTESYGNLTVMTNDSAAINKGGQITLGGYYSGTTTIANYGTIAGRKENSTADNYNGYLALGTSLHGTGNVQRMTILSSGVVTIGGTTNTAYGRLGQLFEVNTLSNYGGVALSTWSTTDDEASLLDLNKSGAAAIGTLTTAVVNGERLGTIAFRGSDATDLEVAAQIKGMVDNTVANNQVPGRLEFHTASSAGTLTQRMTILNSGELIVGGTTNATYDGGRSLIEVNKSANSAGLSLNTWSETGTDEGLLDFLRSKSATIGAHTAMASGDILGGIYFRGSDGGTTFRSAVAIEVAVDGAVTGGGAADMPGRIMFYTSPDGTATLAERLRIDSAGNVGIGMTPSAVLDVTQGTVGNQILGLTSTATNDDPNYKVYQGRQQIIGDGTPGTTADLNTITITQDNTFFIEARVIGRAVSGAGCTEDDGATYILRGGYNNPTGTAAALDGTSPQATFTSETVGAWTNPTLVISSGTVILRVTEVTNCTITWHSTVTVSNVGS